ncbi:MULTISPECIES: electron transfer flavoprotein subunit beta/FixA family protein [Sporomusa]|jgi:electron transfer flavoprotein alpha/beta subunit|uniref:Electron transfer flavoprotein small subunit n=2 Tax=Sporomusa TaxID=2375 RepID=A0ABM9W249_9FIRM|nr:MULTISPECIES: electron transfer flavoprotein subunit beta/FixA family protein [Sporomusa]MCM0761360.1 electron transfer flavoprotein subunit beta/FixA family protein [Sporomusa sphaeroides DSM 2875]OLS56633.1 acryloyl-CoA reductase electron transfer subunit gamma [Sporomusa sphaeroides DSM 2875]CVK18999.1 Acryloyl-CoA reductase electron transfer subunit gamma [Sporomusa sphaeroides DSM 2875]SCM82101.1 Electron transfer flavoprotein subunit beta [uncultured Sporomusa sp.]HML32626.1 electron 
MEIVVCVKQVPDTTEVKIDPVTNTLIRQGVPSIVNPFDKNAVEAALQLKDTHGGKVTVISMGPPQAKDALKECLAMGADEAILLSDRAFGGADTLATSHTLAAGIKKLGKVDIILCGKQAIDGDTAQVGPEIAEHLDIPQVTYVSKIEAEGGKLKVEREQEEGYEIIEVSTPVMLTVVKSINIPRNPTVKGTMKANRKEIPVWTVNEVTVEAEKIGLKGSPTQVRRIFTPTQRTQGEIIQADTAREAAALLLQKLSDAKIV